MLNHELEARVIHARMKEIHKGLKEHPVGTPGAIIDEERRKLVEEAREKDLINKLPLGQREVIEKRYPPEREPPKTLEEIGIDRSVTRESVRQQEVKALRRITRLLEGKEQTVERGKSRKDVDENEVVRLYTAENKTQDEIANIMACNQSLISRLLNKAGVSIRLGGRKKTEININLLAWKYYTEERSTAEIARQLGVSKDIVINRLKDGGYKVRRGRPRKK